MGIFGISKKNKSKENTATRISPLARYEGMRVEVIRKGDGAPIFAARIGRTSSGKTLIETLTEPMIEIPEVEGLAHPIIKIAVRGYDEESKKAVYMEGSASRTDWAKDVWESHDLEIVKVTNDRAFFRMELGVTAEATPLDLKDMHSHECTITDISIGGAGIESERKYSVGDRTVIAADLFENGEISRVCCEIVRDAGVKEKPQGEVSAYGTKLTDISPQDQDKLAGMIFKAQIKQRK